MLLYLSPLLGVSSNACPLSLWYHPTISFSVTTFSSCLQSFPASGSFPISQCFTSGGFGISPSNEYSGLISFRIDCFHLFSVQGTLKSLLQATVQKHQFFGTQAFFIVQLSHPYMTTGETIAWLRRTFVGKVMSLLFNMLSRLVIAFLPRRKCLLISCCTQYVSKFRKLSSGYRTGKGQFSFQSQGRTMLKSVQTTV